MRQNCWEDMFLIRRKRFDSFRLHERFEGDYFNFIGMCKMTSADKERICVQRMQASDMLQFTGMPYNLNCKLKKFDRPGAHAYAFMDLTLHNIGVAKAELKRLNTVIADAKRYVPDIPKWANINIGKIAFRQWSSNYGYTRLVCKPYTYTGEREMFPLELQYMSKNTELGYHVTGEIKYRQNGQIANATVNCWQRRSWKQSADGWLYRIYDGDENQSLAIYEILSTIRRDVHGQPMPVFKCSALLEIESQREMDYLDYGWIEKTLPNDCPKTFTAYRSMKMRNSKGYQKLQQLAAQMGRKI